MKLLALFKKYHLTSIKLGTSGVSMEITFKDEDRKAAWELYIEMLTRIVTQTLPDEMGDELTALDSVHSLFPITREILRRRGRDTIEFSKVAIPVLNQVVRPFTTKWHRESISGAFNDPLRCKEFHKELRLLQTDLRNYNHMLAEIAGVEDLTNLETIQGE